MEDLFGVDIGADVKLAWTRHAAHPSPPGSGPEGETCKTCGHCCRVQGGAKNYYKCELVKWTHGPGTDLRLKDPACAQYEREIDDRQA